MSSNERSPAASHRIRANRKRTSPLPLVFGLLCAGLIVEGVNAALTSPRFQVKSVVVRGNQQVSSDEILRVAAIPDGGNLFRARIREGADRVSRLPRIKRAVVYRRFPDRLVVQVVEREPVALLAVGESYYFVDESGAPYARLDRDGIRLPVLRLDATPALALGRPVKTEAFQVGMKALPIIDRTLSWRSSLQVDPHLDLCLNNGVFSVRLGQSVGLERKLKILKGLLAADPHLQEKARYLDLSAPDYPALMPREPALASLGAGAPLRSIVSGAVQGTAR